MATTHGRGTADPASLAAALVAALAQALLAAERLRGALAADASGPADAATPLAPPVPRPARGAAEPAAGPGGLSRREAEVLRLLAAGMSNRQSAQALCLSPRTVQRHVANIYLKIGAHCRAEATAHALRHGLA